MKTNHKTFKPYDKVLVKSQFDDYWSCDLYSHYNEDTETHETISRIDLYDNDIFPYEGNEELVGTDQNPNEEVDLEEGEWIMVADGDGSFNNALQWHLSKFIRIYTKDNEERFHVAVGLSLADCLYAVKFTDFNPNDMEETKKHILYVKENKIIKHKIDSDYGK